MDKKSKMQMAYEFVRELHLAEERFLEVLLSAFDIKRILSPIPGFELSVSFNEGTPAIWDRRGIRYLREKVLSARKREEYQKELDAFLYKKCTGLTTPDFYNFKDDHFSFRYVSGGTLPIVRFEGDPASKEYYCLNYREIDPIGWNLFNGGSDSRDELMDPEQTIKRELHEELIITDPDKKLRYEFRPDNGKPRDLPAHVGARRQLDLQLPHKNLKNLSVDDFVLKWVDGPDSVCIRMGDDQPVSRGGFFLNINGLDFGIELDKVARIKLPKTAVMFFGETDRGHLLNCPIGLFDVNRFSPDMEPEDLQREPFRPDFFFFAGKRHLCGEIDGVLAGPFIAQLRKLLWPEALAKFEACLRDDARYALCPVTARIILRHRRWETENKRKHESNDKNFNPEDLNWATQAELCRAMERVLLDDDASVAGEEDGSDRAPDKATLSRAVQKGLLRSNDKSGRACRINVDSFKTWIAKQRNLENLEVCQIEDAIMSEIRKRAK